MEERHKKDVEVDDLCTIELVLSEEGKMTFDLRTRVFDVINDVEAIHNIVPRNDNDSFKFVLSGKASEYDGLRGSLVYYASKYAEQLLDLSKDTLQIFEDAKIPVEVEDQE